MNLRTRRNTQSILHAVYSLSTWWRSTRIAREPLEGLRRSCTKCSSKAGKNSVIAVFRSCRTTLPMKRAANLLSRRAGVSYRRRWLSWPAVQRPKFGPTCWGPDMYRNSVQPMGTRHITLDMPFLLQNFNNTIRLDKQNKFKLRANPQSSS